MKPIKTMLRLAKTVVVMMIVGGTLQAAEELNYTDSFNLEDCKLKTIGKNPYFPLKPGYQLLYVGVDEEEGEEETVVLLISVLRKSKVVDGVKCRIVREMEWADGELVEISWNYMAACKQHGGVYYFGEDVDIFEDGEVVNHDGAWLAGVDGAKAGLLMPGLPLVGSRYFQEIAPEIALDRAEHLSVTATIDTPAGLFENCLEVVETTPLEPGEVSTKTYAPGVGLVQDDVLLLVDYGFKGDPEIPEGDDED